MTIYCCVPGCNSKTNINKIVSWHLFPPDEKLKEEWVRKINRRTSDGSLWYPEYYHKICGKHFNITGKTELNNKYPKFFVEKDTDNDDSQKEIIIFEDLELGGCVTINEDFELPQATEPENNSLNEKYTEHVYVKTEPDLLENNILNEIQNFYTKPEPFELSENTSNEIETECTGRYSKQEDSVSEIEILQQQIQRQTEKIETKNKIIERYSTEIKKIEWGM